MLILCLSSRCEQQIWLNSRQASLLESIKASEVIYCHGIWPPLLLVAAAIAYRQSKPYLVSVHGLLSPWAVRKSRVKKWIARTFFGVTSYLERAGAVIFGTRGEHHSSRDFGVTFEPAYIPNGASDKVEKAPPTENERARLFTIAPKLPTGKTDIILFSYPPQKRSGHADRRI